MRFQFWQKRDSIKESQLQRNTPTCMGKGPFEPPTRRPMGEHFHLRGKMVGVLTVPVSPQGTLPLAWEKDSVFMRLSKVFAAICNQIFYKFFYILSVAYPKPKSNHMFDNHTTNA